MTDKKKLHEIMWKVREWKNINKELEKLDSKEASQAIAVNREHIHELEKILGVIDEQS